MEFKEAFSLGAVIVLLIVFFVMLKLKNRKIRYILHTMKDEGRPAPATKRRRSGGGGGYVNVDQLEEGSTLAEDVHDPGGKIVLLEAGTVLTAKNIDKLRNWEIKSVLVK